MELDLSMVSSRLLKIEYDIHGIAKSHDDHDHKKDSSEDAQGRIVVLLRLTVKDIHVVERNRLGLILFILQQPPPECTPDIHFTLDLHSTACACGVKENLVHRIQ